MNILSLRFLLFSGISSIFTWLFPKCTRKYTVALINLGFLYLLHMNGNDIIYILGLCVYTWIAGELLNKGRNGFKLFLMITVPVLGLCFYKYGGYFDRRILAPLGLSFFTFKAIHYIADIYDEKLISRNLIEVFDYLAFFPTFMAGPIHRCEAFFEELERPYSFDYRESKNGCILAGIGLFQKIVIADELSILVNAHLNTELTGWYTILGVILYSFYIYADFDAYSNTAIGIAGMMGFHLERNFHTPYLSQSLSEFWKRWHISLSSWLRDYIYIPLGGNRKGTFRKYFNLLMVFVVSGLWHGSTYVFLIWGVGHGICSILEAFLQSVTVKWQWKKYFKPVWILINFAIVTCLWVFFRSTSLSEAVNVFQRMTAVSGSPLWMHAEALGLERHEWFWGFILVFMIVISDLFRYKRDMIAFLADRNIIIRWLFYVILMVIALIFGVYGPGYDAGNFIYVTF